MMGISILFNYSVYRYKSKYKAKTRTHSPTGRRVKTKVRSLENRAVALVYIK